MSLRKLKLAKILRFFRNSLLISFALTIWFIGSSIVIQIDSEERAGSSNRFEERLDNLSKHVDKICKQITREELEYLPIIKISEAEEALRRAKQEKSIRNSLIYFPDLNQMWCLVPKAASTSWSEVILKEINKHHLTIYYLHNGKHDLTKVPLQVLYKENFGMINKQAYENATKSEAVRKILLVRNPFDRIASAYEEKLKDRNARDDSFHFYQKYGALISRKYRKNPRANKRREPTFEEFIDYLLDTDPLDYDEHWKPVSIQCGLCHIRYDQIIRVEDLEQLSEFHLKKLSFGESNSLPIKNKIKKKTVSSYYTGIPRSKVLSLFKKYRDDFRLFDYNFLDFYIPFTSSKDTK